MASRINIFGACAITQSNSTRVRVHMEQTGSKLNGFAHFGTPQGEV
ncbi:hypothetical protein [Streptomyces canus]